MDYKTVHIYELGNWLRNPKVILVDVREEKDYLHGHIPGAKCRPYGNIHQWMKEFSFNKKILLYCDYGSTSMLAAKKLTELGYDAYTLLGGYHAYRK